MGRRLPTLPSLQVALELGGADVPVRRVLRHGPLHDGDHGGGDRGVDGGQAGDRRLGVLERDAHGAVAIIGWPAREELEENDSQGVEVGLGGGHLASGLLRRHVAHGAEDVPRLGDLALGEGSGDAEVDHLGLAVLAEEDVQGLDVAMDDPILMGVA